MERDAALVAPLPRRQLKVKKTAYIAGAKWFPPLCEVLQTHRAARL